MASITSCPSNASTHSSPPAKAPAEEEKAPEEEEEAVFENMPIVLVFVSSFFPFSSSVSLPVAFAEKDFDELSEEREEEEEDKEAYLPHPPPPLPALLCANDTTPMTPRRLVSLSIIVIIALDFNKLFALGGEELRVVKVSAVEAAARL